MNSILIVDDQIGIRRLLEELFKRENYEVHLAVDGREAIAKAQELMPDIIIMDMKMPVMNGLEAAKEIINSNEQQAIIMMTAYEEIDLVNQILETGVKRCITKPFDIMVLREMVREALTDKQI